MSLVTNQSSFFKSIRLANQSNLTLDLSFWFVLGLTKQSNLTWLSLAGNQLSSLDTGILEKLPQLRYLSVENNVITHLRGLQVSALLSFLFVCFLTL